MVQFAGEFQLHKCELISSAGVKSDITNIVVEIDLFEDIFKSAMTGSIIFTDTNNLVDNMPIIGQEYVSFKISTPGLNRENIDFDYTENVFCVYEIGGRESSSSSEVVELKICSPELLRNERTRVSKSFENTVTSIALSLLTDKNYINTKKKIFTEPSLGVRKVLSPSFHPFSLIKNLAQEAISIENNSPHFLFFENTRGFHFRSLQNLYSEGVSGQFHFGDKGFEDAHDESGSSGRIAQGYKRILELTIPQKNNMLEDVNSGMLGATLIMHDIYNKKYNKSAFSYFNDHNTFGRLEGNSPNRSPTKYNFVAIDEENNTVGSFIESRIHLHPTSTTLNGIDSQFMTDPPAADPTLDQNKNYVSNSADRWLLHRQQRMHELNRGMVVNMTINGSTAVSVGQIIDLTIPVAGTDNEKSNSSKLQSGKYLISKLRHTFSQPTRQHLISLQATKDSNPIELESKASGQEPKSSATSIVTQI